MVATLSESMPLLLKSINTLLEDKNNHGKILRRGLNKTGIKELRRSSAFPFFLPSSGKVISRYPWIDSSFEFSVLCPQLRKRQGPRQNRFDFHPPSRTIFFQLLTLMAESRGWSNVDEAAESLRMQSLTFSIFRNEDSAVDFFVKGEELDLPDGTIETKSWEKGFVPDVYLAHALPTRPLLKDYCYLMASLGLLEIEEEERELRRLFVEETKLSSLVFRAEGGRIVVPQKNYKKLRKVLEEYGVIKA